MYLVSPRLSHVKVHRTRHHATTSYISCRLGQEVLHIAGVYWPNKNDTSDTTVWSRVSRTYGLDTPAACAALLGGVVDEAIDAGATLLIGGDFNSDIRAPKSDKEKDKDKYGLRDVEKAWLLLHSSSEAEREVSSYGFVDGNTSRIDYQFYRGPAVISASCKVVELDEVAHDHRPLFAEYVMRSSVPFKKAMKMRVHADVDVRNKPKVEHLKELLKKFDLSGLEGLPPDEQLRRITAFTVKQARRLFDKPRRSKNGWSPTTRAHTICLKQLVLMKRHAFGSHKYKKWTSDTFGKGMGLVRRGWKSDVWALAKQDPADFYGFLNQHSTTYGFYYWFPPQPEDRLSLETIREVLPKAIGVVRHRLHQRKCSDIRAAYNERSRQIEEVSKKGILRHLIKDAIGGKRHYVSWEDLEQDGVVHTDPKHIHDTITDSFKEWFRAVNPLPAYSTEWEDQLLDWEGFQKAFEDIPVPIELKRKIWASLARECPRRQESEDLLSSPILYEDFEAAIKSAPTDSAAGMTGSYNMVKQWPKELKVAAYNALAKIWDKSIPFEWRWRWIVPIPKVANPTVQDFRPIALLEVLRKIWLGITVDRIQRLWTAPGDGRLNGSQYGFMETGAKW